MSAAKRKKRKLPNGARSIMASRREPKKSLDLFCTPPWATRALCEIVLPHISHLVFWETSVWEPACGEGHMSEVLKEYFGMVHSSDIHDHGYSHTNEIVPFLDPWTDDRLHFDWIITNPPFGELTEQFIRHALDLARVGVAMFVRQQFVSSVGRYERLWVPDPPTLEASFSERVPLHKGRWEPNGSTATEYCWLVWMKGRESAGPGQWQKMMIPPGQRVALTRPDDRARFAAWSITKEAAE
jgi:hypothetical protein